TTTRSSTDTIVIGTTGRKPSTIVPADSRVTMSRPPSVSTATACPGGGGGITFCTMATPTTAAAHQSVAASAPHLVVRRQKSAATSSGASPAYPAKAYCVASAKIDGGVVSAMRYATTVRITTKARPVAT